MRLKPTTIEQMIEFDLTDLFEAAHAMQANWERADLQFCLLADWRSTIGAKFA